MSSRSSCSPSPPIARKRAENKQARPPTNLPESLQGTCHHVAILMRSLPLQFLLSEPLLIANMSEGRPVAGSNRAGSPRTCQGASEAWPLPALSAALRSKGYARECSALAWNCCGFYNL